jgi:hypothetical protein
MFNSVLRLEGALEWPFPRVRGNSLMPDLTPPQRRRLALAVAALVLVQLGPRTLVDVWRQRPFGIVEKDGLHLRDFTSHARMVRLALEGRWAGGERSLYTPEAHLEMTSAWVGRPMSRALPFGYSPTMIWVLAPFALWPDPWAYLLWTLAGFSLLAWMLWPREGWPVVAGLVFVSPLATWAFLNGQTSPFSNAALLLLALPERAPDERGWRWRVLIDAVVLWLLTARPPVAVMAGGALLAVGRWRAVALALVLTAAGTAAAHPLLGPGWAADYVTLARTYNSEEADPAFAWCLQPTYLSNLRAALWELGVSDAQACRLSGTAWLGAMGALVVAGWRGWVAPWAVWCPGLLAFLILSPHLSMTEDLHLHAGAVIAGVAMGSSSSRLGQLLPALFVAGCWAGNIVALQWGPHWPWPALIWPWPALVAKVALAGAVLAAGRHHSPAARS